MQYIEKVQFILLLLHYLDAILDLLQKSFYGTLTSHGIGLKYRCIIMGFFIKKQL